MGLFDESLPSFQDRDLWIRISREFHFDYVQEPLLNYFIHSEKVWTNLEALTRGLEIMAEKYGSFPTFRKQCGSRYLEFGVPFLRSEPNGKGKAGAFEIHPLVSLPNQAISVFGSRIVWPKIVHYCTRKESEGNGRCGALRYLRKSSFLRSKQKIPRIGLKTTVKMPSLQLKHFR